MGEAQGKKVDTGAVAAQAIEAQTSSGQISQGEAVWFARTEQHHREKTWQTADVLHKRYTVPGEEKETLA